MAEAMFCSTTRRISAAASSAETPSGPAIFASIAATALSRFSGILPPKYPSGAM